MRRFKYIVVLFLFLCNISLAQQSQESLEKFQKGVDAYANGDYDTAANIWLIEAYEGSHDAQFNLGVMYIEGKGVAKNITEAIFWFDKAASTGHIEAQYNLGHLYFQNSDDEESIKKGVDWWRKSAEQGFAIAQYNYGRALFHGIGVEKNITASKSWMEQSAILGESVASKFLEANVDIYNATTDQSVQINDTIQSASSENSESENLESEIKEEQPATETIETEVDRTDSNNLTSSLSEDEAQYIVDSEEPDIEPQDSHYYAMIGKESQLIYAQFNSQAPVIGELEESTLVRVVAENQDWIQVQVPAGFPGWITKAETKILNSFVEILDESKTVFADPTEEISNNDFGELHAGEKLLILDENDQWYQVQSPEIFSGWIEKNNVSRLSTAEIEIATIWQAQRLKRKIAALSTKEETLLASAAIESETTDASEALDLLASVGVEPVVKELTVDEFVSQLKEEFVIKKAPTELASLPSEPDQIRRISRRGVQLLSLPSATGSPLFNITQETLVNIVDLDDGWVRVSIPGGLPVWIAKSSTNAKNNKVLIIENDVKMSIQPRSGTSAAELGGLEEGTLVDILDIKGDWVRVLAPKSISAWMPESDIDPPGDSEEIEIEWFKQKSKLFSRFSKLKSPENTGLKLVQNGNAPEQNQTEALAETYSGESGSATYDTETDITDETPEQKEGDQGDGKGGEFSLAEESESTEFIEYADQYTLVDPSDQILQERSGSASGDTVLKSTGYNNDNTWLFSNSPDRATFQLFRIKDRDKALELYRKMKGNGQFFSTVSKSNHWYYILLGSFNDVASAEAFRDQLPRWSRNAEIKTFGMLQSKRCEKIDKLQSFESQVLAQHCHI